MTSQWQQTCHAPKTCQRRMIFRIMQAYKRPVLPKACHWSVSRRCNRLRWPRGAVAHAPRNCQWHVNEFKEEHKPCSNLDIIFINSLKSFCRETCGLTQRPPAQLSIAAATVQHHQCCPCHSARSDILCRHYCQKCLSALTVADRGHFGQQKSKSKSKSFSRTP